MIMGRGPPSPPRISMYRLSRTSGKMVVRCVSQSFSVGRRPVRAMLGEAMTREVAAGCIKGQHTLQVCSTAIVAQVLLSQTAAATEEELLRTPQLGSREADWLRGAHTPQVWRSVLEWAAAPCKACADSEGSWPSMDCRKVVRCPVASSCSTSS